jgi:putative oxidoreductase
VIPIREDVSDLIFRVLFSAIFIALGAEHLLSDVLLQTLMPGWLEPKRLVSIASGVVLLGGGLSIALGYKVDVGATVLGVFLIAVTAVVHGPGLVGHPATVPHDAEWLWTIYQRSNFVKNVCLLGVCVHLVTHRPGRYSLDTFMQARRARHRAAA